MPEQASALSGSRMVFSEAFAQPLLTPMPSRSSFAFVGSCTLALISSAVSASAQRTVAHWNFDAGFAATTFATNPALDSSGSDYVIHGFDDIVGPSYSADTLTGKGLCARLYAPQDGYTTDPTFNYWSPKQWTIEVSVRLDSIDGWNTIIGRDGSSFPGVPKSDFYFQNDGEANRFRLDFATADGARYLIESPFVAEAGVWYHVALVSDGATVSMHIDRNDGRATSSPPPSRSTRSRAPTKPSPRRAVSGPSAAVGMTAVSSITCMVASTTSALPKARFRLRASCTLPPRSRLRPRPPRHPWPSRPSRPPRSQP